MRRFQLVGRAGFNSQCWRTPLPSSLFAPHLTSSLFLLLLTSSLFLLLTSPHLLLLGAIAGRTGALGTLLYVAMVCVGAPFSSSKLVDPMWNKGAIVSSSGGYLVGFIFASYIMGMAAERGAGRGAPRSLLLLILWMFAAEGAIYALALFWLPFGMAIAKNVSPSAICPESGGAQKCLANIFAWGFTPFIPGDLFKMAMVAITVPFAWSTLLKIHQWRTKDEGVMLASAPIDEKEEMEAVDPVDLSSPTSSATTNGHLPGAVASSDGIELKLNEPSSA